MNIIHDHKTLFVLRLIKIQINKQNTVRLRNSILIMLLDVMLFVEKIQS